MSEIVESSVVVNENEAAKAAAEKEARIREDLSKPYDPDALLEIRHLSKKFPIKKNLFGKVLQEQLFGQVLFVE